MLSKNRQIEETVQDLFGNYCYKNLHMKCAHWWPVFDSFMSDPMLGEYDATADG